MEDLTGILIDSLLGSHGDPASACRMCLLRSHEMDGDSAEVGYQGIAVDQWPGRVSDVECDALAGGQSGCLLQG